MDENLAHHSAPYLPRQSSVDSEGYEDGLTLLAMVATNPERYLSPDPEEAKYNKHCLEEEEEENAAMFKFNVHSNCFWFIVFVSYDL